MTCPTCKSIYETEVGTCAKCGFPFSGTESQKSSFIAQQILKVGKIDDARSSVKTAKQVLFGIGGLNILMAILNPAYLILGLVVGVSFVVFGFVVERSPFLFLLIALSALLLLYLTAALINPISIVQGLVWKILYITLLAYALVRVKHAEKLKMESTYLSGK